MDYVIIFANFASRKKNNLPLLFQVGVNAYHTVIPLLDKMVVVKEEWIALAILRLVELEKCVVEGICRRWNAPVEELV